MKRALVTLLVLSSAPLAASVPVELDALASLPESSSSPTLPASPFEEWWRQEKLELARSVEPLRTSVSAVTITGETDATSGAPGAAGASTAETERPRRLPFLGHLARERGHELPLPLGAGGVYYYLSRDIEITDVRVGRNGAPPVSVTEYAQFAAHAEVNNVNAKFDVWLLPFLNVYAIAGYVWNQADTTIDVTLPPLLPGGETRRRRVELPTTVEGSVGGLGVTLAGGFKSYFFAADVNAVQADLGFDDRFDALVASLRFGWFGKFGSLPTRLWLNATYWDTFAEAASTIADPDGGTLSFIVDQGPAEPYTYGVGGQLSFRPWFEFAADVGADFHGGWYVALVPVFRF